MSRSMRDMRSSMEVGTYPVMRFDLDSATATTATASDSLVVMLHGRLTVHGVTRDVALPGRVWSSGDTVRVRSDFPLNLKDYHIGGLSKMLGVLKMHEGIEVHVALVFGRPAVP